MAAPNIVNVATITAKTKGQALTTSLVDFLENAALSGKVFKVNSLIVANIDGVNNVDITVTFVDASGPTTYSLAKTVTVPADASLIVIDKSTALYLEEGDKIQIQATAVSDAEAVISYEEIS